MRLEVRQACWRAQLRGFGWTAPILVVIVVSPGLLCGRRPMLCPDIGVQQGLSQCYLPPVGWHRESQSCEGAKGQL